jgi:hypothetical protein
MPDNIDAKPAAGRQLGLIDAVIDRGVPFRPAYELQRWPKARHFNECHCVACSVTGKKIRSATGMTARRMNLNGVTLSFQGCVHEELR